MRIGDQLLTRLGFIDQSCLAVDAAASEVLAEIGAFLRSGGRDSQLSRSFQGQVAGHTFHLSRRHVFEESGIDGQVSDTGDGTTVSVRASCGIDVGRFAVLAPLLMFVGTIFQQLRSPETRFDVLYVLTATFAGALVGLVGLFFGGLRARSFNRENLSVVQRVLSRFGVPNDALPQIETLPR